MSVFHVVFNLVTMFVLVWFIKPLNKLVYWVIKDRTKVSNFAKNENPLSFV